MNPAEEKLASWMTCRLSGDRLHLPCCADRLGSIFNKEAVLQVCTMHLLMPPGVQPSKTPLCVLPSDHKMPLVSLLCIACRG